MFKEIVKLLLEYEYLKDYLNDLPADEPDPEAEARYCELDKTLDELLGNRQPAKS